MTTRSSGRLIKDPLERGWHATPVFSIARTHRGGGTAVTTVGGDAATAEDAADLLAQLLRDWDLSDHDSLLSHLWRSEQPLSVDDRTLLALTLATSADVNLQAGTAVVTRNESIPDKKLLVALAIDMVIAELLSHDVLGACVENGGQIRVTGTAPDGHAWLLRLDEAGTTSTVGLRDGACSNLEQTAPDHGLPESIVMFATTSWQATLFGVQALRLSADAAAAHLQTLGLPARLRSQADVRTFGDWASKKDILPPSTPRRVPR